METCERCPATAKITVGKPGLAELHFCMHHFNENASALYMRDWLILDHTEPAAVPAVAHASGQPVTHRKIER